MADGYLFFMAFLPTDIHHSPPTQISFPISILASNLKVNLFPNQNPFILKRKKIIILGAAGRDFHNFNTYYRDQEVFEVVAFTAAQIPDIDDRRYPAVLAGSLYPMGIPIYDEKDLPQLIEELEVEECVFSYSDVSYDYVMRLSAVVNAAGANFLLLGTKATMLKKQ